MGVKGRELSGNGSTMAEARRSSQSVPAHYPDRLRPWLLAAATALCVSRPLFPSEAAASQGDGLPVVMLWIALAVCFLLGAVGRLEVCLRFGWADAAVLLLVGLHTASAVWAAGHSARRPAVNMLWEWLAMGLSFLLFRQLIAGRREARAVAAAMVALAVALSTYGLYQVVYELPRTRAEYAADPDQALRAAGIWYTPGSPQREVFENRLKSPEPLATFALTNSLAGYLAPWLVVAAGIGVCAWADRGRDRRTWPAIAVCALPVAACLLLTRSRSGYAATILGLLLVALGCRERKPRIGWKLVGVGVAAAAILAAAAMFAGRLEPQLLSKASKSLGYRIQYWQATLHIVAEHPLAGCGPGNFQNAYTKYKLPEASEEVADPHNFLLEVWATAGTPAMLALLAVLGCLVGGLWRHRQMSPPKDLPAAKDADDQQGRQQAIRPGACASSEPCDRPGFVFGGAVCGFLLALPVGLISAAPPGFAPLLLGLPLAAGCIVLLSKWIDQGRLPAMLPAIGIATLLAHLLAAGGIGFPGVAGTFWLLLALSLNITNADRPKTMPRIATCGALVTVLALAIACYASAYDPVLRSQAAMRLAVREPSRAEQYFRAAAAADPLSPQPWHQLAALAFNQWRQQPDDQRFAQFERYNSTALELDPNAGSAWLALGDYYWAAFQKTRRTSHVEKAVKAYQRAVQLYPNSGLYRAKLALALAAAGDHTGFRSEADASLQLDKLTPHADKKLPVELRNQLLRSNRMSN